MRYCDSVYHQFLLVSLSPSLCLSHAVSLCDVRYDTNLSLSSFACCFSFHLCVDVDDERKLRTRWTSPSIQIVNKSRRIYHNVVEKWRNHRIYGRFKTFFFIAHHWYSNSVCLSVCLSVRCVPVFYGNSLTCCHSFFSTWLPNHSSFMSIKHFREIPTGPLRGAKYMWGIKMFRFPTNNSLYLASVTR